MCFSVTCTHNADPACCQWQNCGWRDWADHYWFESLSNVSLRHRIDFDDHFKARWSSRFCSLSFLFQYVWIKFHGPKCNCRECGRTSENSEISSFEALRFEISQLVLGSSPIDWSLISVIKNNQNGSFNHKWFFIIDFLTFCILGNEITTMQAILNF